MFTVGCAEVGAPYGIACALFSNRNLLLFQVLFNLSDCQFPIMEQAGRQCGIAAGFLEHLGEMLERAAAAGRDDRNADHLHDRLGQRQVPSLSIEVSRISPAPRS